jgi:hypothetical protein
MESPRKRHDSNGLMALQTHGFDLMAQVEAFFRCIREVQQHVATLKENGSPSAHADALHAIRKNVATLLTDCDDFCAMLRDVQSIAEDLSPERRRERKSVASERRRA